jgi:hypothetical protein
LLGGVDDRGCNAAGRAERGDDNQDRLQGRG